MPLLLLTDASENNAFIWQHGELTNMSICSIYVIPKKERNALTEAGTETYIQTVYQRHWHDKDSNITTLPPLNVHDVKTKCKPFTLIVRSKNRIGLTFSKCDRSRMPTLNGLRSSSWRCRWIWRRRSVSIDRHNGSKRCCND